MIPDKVHLVGSVGLDTVTEVFETVGRTLGDRLRRVPDGEPGGRRTWINWQAAVLRGNPFLKPHTERAGANAAPRNVFGLADGVRADEVRFGELGYAREARSSYLDLLDARASGFIRGDTRFQICLPTPFAVISAYTAADFDCIEAAYERAMLSEIASICRHIPHRDLSIQWDICSEMILWDGQLPNMFGKKIAEAEILARLRRLGESIPTNVELGFHLCYGDRDGKHFVEPRDAERMTALANGLISAVERSVSYLHMPVPIARDDDAYFRPLRDLRTRPDTELYLGLVHPDGVAGVRRRIDAAGEHLGNFGIATECGMGRCRSPEVVRQLIQIHADSTSGA